MCKDDSHVLLAWDRKQLAAAHLRLLTLRPGDDTRTVGGIEAQRRPDPPRLLTEPLMPAHHRPQHDQSCCNRLFTYVVIQTIEQPCQNGLYWDAN